MAISAFANACDTVQELEDDPNIDPLVEWQKDRQKMINRLQIEKSYHMEE